MQNQKIFSRMWRAWRTLPNASPQRWFVVLALLFGILFAVLTPAYDPPDEYSHLSRAWQIGHGQLLSQKTKDGKDTGGYVPVSFKKLGQAVRASDYSLAKLGNLGSIPLNASQQNFHGFPNLVIYSPVVYAPQAIGLDAGELLHLPAYYTLVLARLFNLVAYTLLFYWAIRLLPFGKWAGVVIGLLPMHILLAGSMSADAVTDGLIALAVSAVLYLRHKAVPITRRTYIWLLILAAVLSLTKLPFPLLICLYLLLPTRILGGTTKKRWAMLGGTALIAFVVGVGWLLLAKHTMVPYGPPGVDNAAQIHTMVHNPFTFITAFYNTYGTVLSDSFVQNYVIGVGPVLAWFPIWVSMAYTAFLMASFVRIRTTSAAALSRAQKAIVAIVGVGIVGLISLLLYISWTPVGAPHIEGVQARYFTPLLLLLVPLVAVNAGRKDQTQEGLLSIAWYRYVPLAYLLLSIMALFYYFYRLKIVVPF